MHAILKDLFYQVYFSLFILGLVAVVLIDHGEVVLWVNQHRNSVLDGVMPRWTHLGDGFMVVGAILVSLFVNRRIGILLIGIGLAQAALTALLKRVIFRGTPRPKSFFDEGVLDFIQGVKVHSWHSFPSGHTMTAFSIAAFVSFWSPKYLKILLLILATSVGFSRIYLSQHFLVDVVFGSLIGVLLSAIFYLATKRYIHQDSFLA